MDPVPLTPGTQVDILRITDNKTEMSYAWKGPGDLLEIDVANGTCIVKWQSIPYLTPIRHVRPDVVLHYVSMHTAARELGVASLNLAAPHSQDMVYHTELNDHEGDPTAAAADVA